ncbi:hypothetical protein BST97_04325 [Nonlabens spongiae]|uniref:LTD domain-containing protein n=2 Tax=Nonlabens spongiae TaxID=331648 RepID=A0A1W6MI29_9FLAO|nr:hypothetical protein BST97_04325 [Nonlabens spongiae]
MKKIYNLAFLLSAFLCAGLVSGQTTTIDFETDGEGYSSTATEGSSFIDVFNRIDASAESGGNLGGNSTFIWAVEDTNVTPGSITLDQIDVTGSTSFTFSIDMLAHHFQDWDSTDELNITYSLDSGSAQNLMSVQMHQGSGDANNGPAALDTDFDGDGECGAGLVLPALTTGTQHGCSVTDSNFATFTTSAIPLSGNSTLDIVLSFENLTSSDEGIYIDNIVITQGAGALPPSVGFDNTASSENETNLTFTSSIIPVTLSNYGGSQVDLSVSVTGGTAEMADYTLNTTSLSFTGNGTQNITFDINPDAGFEDETIEITLTETTSTGATVSPDTHTLTIFDDETAPLVINEILADPDGTTGDANGDGVADTSDDEFIEIFNNSSSAIDMSNYTLSDGFGVRHTFPSGTVLLAQQAIVVFGGGNVEDFTGVPGLVQVAGTLGLNNSGDTITIADGSGTALVVETYGSAGNNQSIARDPDFTGAFVDHSTITTNPIDFSPGSDNTDGSSLTDPNTWTGATDTDWATGSNWVNGIAPRSIDDIIIPNGLGNYPIISSTTGGVGNDLTVEGAASLIINGGGSLILNGASTGEVTYNIAIPDTNWHLIGTPVSGEDYDSAWITANNIASGTGSNRGVSTYINTTDGDGDWVYAQDGVPETFANTIGYSVLTNAAGDIALTGSLLTTDLAVPITESANFPEEDNSFNLVGNPFAAYLSIDDFLTLSTNAAALEDVREAVYVWNGSSYLPLTIGFIHPGQGFFLSSAGASESVDFNENMLSHQTGLTFYSTPSNNSSIQLVMSVGNEARSTKVNFINGKTLGLDPRFDVATFGGQVASLEIYTALVDGSYQDTNFAIQALPDTNLDAMIIPVGVTAAAGQMVSIVADVNGLPINTNVYLEDRANGTFNLLGNGNSFDFTAAGDMTGFGRFYLHATTQTLSNEIISQDLDVSVYQSDSNTLSISGLNDVASQIRLFDLLGKQVIAQELSQDGAVATVDVSNIKTGVYIAQITSGDEATSIKLIINK